MYLCTECIKKQTQDEQLVPTINKSTKNYGTCNCIQKKKNQNGFQCKYSKGQWQQNGKQFFYCFM